MDGNWEGTPKGLNEDEQEEFQRRWDKLVEEANQQNNDEICWQASEAAVWAILTAKLASLHSPWISNNPAEQLMAILNLSSYTTASSSLLSTLLSQAPHLAKPTASSGDLHLNETWKLWQLFTMEKAVDAIVDVVQQQQLDEPIPQSIWRDIIQDRFVNASMDLGYDHQDELKDFLGGYAIVKKDQASAKRPVQTEAEWRAFSPNIRWLCR